MARQVHGGGAGEVQQPALARAVPDVPGLALVTRRRHDHDDAAAARLLDHAPRDVLRDQERAREVDGELAVPPLERHVDDTLAAEDARVVHDDVHAAVRLAHARHHRLDLGLVGGVGDDAERVTPSRLDPLRALPRVVLDHVDARDASALIREPLRDAAADVGARAGDDGDLPGQSPAHGLSATTRTPCWS